jgi:hypothetical protein
MERSSQRLTDGELERPKSGTSYTHLLLILRKQVFVVDWA